MQVLRSICVYCGSANEVDPRFREAAAALGRMLGEAEVGLVYGGGRVGLMGEIADGVLTAGGRVTGIIPGHLHDREVAHPGVTDLLVVGSMHERKMLMAERADGFVILPGGYGTLDEMFEILTWRQLGLHDKPIVIANLHGYWDKLVALLDNIREQGFAGAKPRQLYTVVESLDEVLPALRREPPPAVPVETKWS